MGNRWSNFKKRQKHSAKLKKNESKKAEVIEITSVDTEDVDTEDVVETTPIDDESE